jgi:hypothetical protein
MEIVRTSRTTNPRRGRCGRSRHRSPGTSASQEGELQRLPDPQPYPVEARLRREGQEKPDAPASRVDEDEDGGEDEEAEEKGAGNPGDQALGG